jgi:hypothetical protein
MAYRILQTSVLLILAILTTGCASNLKMTYKSAPAFATVYEGGRQLGVAPVTVEYAVTEDAKKRGWMLLSGTSARWVSGASAEFPVIHVDLKSGLSAEVPAIHVDLKSGLSKELTFNRPENYPGLEKDQAFVREVFKNYLLLRQVQAQEDIANYYRNKEFSDALKEIGKIGQPQTPYPLPRPPTNCTSTIVGNTVRTTCY